MTNTPKPEALKGCPFCGAQPVTQDYRSSSDETGEVYGYAAVECHHGKSDGGAVFHCETLAEAITAWNTRASAVPVKNEALASLVNELMFPANWRARKVGIASDLYDSDAPFRAATTITTLAAALTWYGEQARLARLIHSEGDAGRKALAEDGGTLARTTLERTAQP